MDGGLSQSTELLSHGRGKRDLREAIDGTPDKPPGSRPRANEDLEPRALGIGAATDSKKSTSNSRYAGNLLLTHIFEWALKESAAIEECWLELSFE